MPAPFVPVSFSSCIDNLFQHVYISFVEPMDERPKAAINVAKAAAERNPPGSFTQFVQHLRYITSEDPRSYNHN